MKLRRTFCLLTILFLMSTLNLTMSFAQETPQSPLPEGARARLVPHLVTGYASGVTAIAYKPNSSTLVTAAARLILWDTTDNTPPRVLKVLDVDNSSGYYTAIAFSPDGTTLASASGLSVQLRDATTGRLRTWDVPGAGITDVLKHRNHVHGMAFSPDGSTLVTADGDLHVWDVATGRHITRVRSLNAGRVVYNPDGNMLASSGNYTGKVDLWRATGIPSLPIKFIRSLEGFTRDVWDVAFSSDGTMLASAGWEEADSSWSVRLWDATTGSPLRTLTGHTGFVRSVSFSPDGTTLASGSWDRTVRLWDATTGSPLGTLTGHTYEVKSVSFSADGTTLASGSEDGTVLLWELIPAVDTPENIAADGTPTFNPSTITDQTFTSRSPITPLVLPEATGGTTPYAYSVSALPVGLSFDTATRQLHGPPTTVVSAHPVTYTVRDAAGRTASLTFSITVTDAPPSGSDITFHPSEMTNQRFAAGSPIMSLVLPEATGGTAPYTYTLSPLPDGLLFDATVRLLTGTPTTVGTTGVTYAATDTGGTTASITFTITVQDSPQLRNTFTEHTGPVNRVAFSPDGNTLATAGDAIYLWEVATGILKTKFTERTAGGLGIAFSPDGKTMASVSASYLFLWDVATGTLISDFTNNRGGGLSVAYSPDGKRIAAGAYGAVNLWDTATGLKAELTGHTDEVYGVAYSPDGNTLVSGCKDRTVRFWNAITGELKNTIEHTAQIWSVAYSPDGSTIASTSFDNTVRLWDAATGRLLNTMEHTDWFPSVAYSPDGYTLASGCWDNTVRLWDAATGRLLNTLTGHTGPVNSVAFSPDGTTLATGSVDGTVLLWELAPTVDAYPAWDVNEDGQTSIVDLIVVLAAFEKTPIVNPRTDVNGDGTVDKQDIIIVATHLGESTTPAAPISVALPERLTPETLRQALDLLRAHNDGSLAFQRGIAHLEQLLALLIPKETALLANYPNPFNPETWIPYQLAAPTDVTVSIYSADGRLVQILALGHQPVGLYESRSRAAYWDGRNALGESVASGVYFYTLTAGEFTATRKMLIMK